MELGVRILSEQLSINDWDCAATIPEAGKEEKEIPGEEAGTGVAGSSTEPSLSFPIQLTVGSDGSNRSSTVILLGLQTVSIASETNSYLLPAPAYGRHLSLHATE